MTANRLRFGRNEAFGFKLDPLPSINNSDRPEPAVPTGDSDRRFRPAIVMEATRRNRQHGRKLDHD